MTDKQRLANSLECFGLRHVETISKRTLIFELFPLQSGKRFANDQHVRSFTMQTEPFTIEDLREHVYHSIHCNSNFVTLIDCPSDCPCRWGASPASMPIEIAISKLDKAAELCRDLLSEIEAAGGRISTGLDNPDLAIVDDPAARPAPPSSTAAPAAESASSAIAGVDDPEDVAIAVDVMSDAREFAAMVRAFRTIRRIAYSAEHDKAPAALLRILELSEIVLSHVGADEV